jgi:carbonic anhydrase
MPGRSYSRRSFVKLGGIAAGGLGLAGVAGRSWAASPAAPSSHPRGPDEDPLTILLRGNERWALGKPEHPDQSVARREEQALVAHQTPFAMVVSCIDSRVPPEIIFDQGIGNIFVIRTAGETIDDLVLGSIEYGPVINASPQLVMVLGHDRCGAIHEAIHAIEHPDPPPPGHIGALVDALRPAYDIAVKEQPPDLEDHMIDVQVRLMVAVLKHDPVLAQRVADGKLSIVGGRYDLFFGRVSIIA